MNDLKLVKVASLGVGNKTAYSVAGERFFVPERFRTTIKTGDSILLKTQRFEQSGVFNPDGSRVLNEDGTPKLIDKPFERTEVTFVGDFKDAVIAKNEAAINEGVEEKIIAAEIAKATKEFSLDDVAIA